MDDIATLHHTLTICGKVANRHRWREAAQRRNARLGGLSFRLRCSLGDRFVRRERVGGAVVFMATNDAGEIVEAARVLRVSGQRTVEELERPFEVELSAPALLSKAFGRKGAG